MEKTDKKEKKILAIVGMPGTGKSTVVQSLVQDYSLPFLHFGNITIQEVRKRNLPETQENEKKVRMELRAKYGMAAYAQLSIPIIHEILEKNDTMLIDGLYSWSEYTLMRQSISAKILLICIISRRETRYHRLAIREYRPLTPEEAEKRDFAEIEALEKGGPIALCDYYLTNDAGIEDLQKALSSLAQELGLQKMA
ncbi:MAG: AAA family ATPase [Candidatus Brocadiae bacterium]|nr:AAA family ATPase [Candidatus Brocadiia bacterium]